MKNKTTYTCLAFFAALLMIYGCASSKVAKNSPVGSWDYTVRSTPNGDVSGTLNIEKDGDEYTGNLTSNAGTIDLNNVTIEDNKLSSSFNYQGTPLQLTGTFSGDDFTGSVDAGSDSFPVEATRGSGQ